MRAAIRRVGIVDGVHLNWDGVFEERGEMAWKWQRGGRKILLYLQVQ